MSPNTGADLYRTLGSLEAGLESLTLEFRRSNDLHAAKAEHLETRITSLETSRNKQTGAWAVLVVIGGLIWTLIQKVLP